MHKLLIVDDEYWVRKRLITTIDWNALGIDEVYEAEDGKEALRISIEHEPDIIVTDINMPELTGIELMQALNESALYPRIVLISGFNEFEFARSAIKLGAVDYLLKPVDENDLIKIIKNCIEDFDNRKKEKDLFKAAVEFSGEIRERVLSDLLTGKIDDPNNALLCLNRFGVDFSYSSAICLITHSSSMAITDKNDYVEDTLISFSISNIMSDVLPHFFQNYFVLQMDDLNVAILFSKEKGEILQNSIKEVIDNVNKKLNKLFNINITFGLGEEVSDILNLHKSFKTANYAINSCNYNDWNSILNYGENNKTEQLEMQSVYFDYNLETIAVDIKSCDRASASNNVKLLLDEFLKHNNHSPTPLQIKLFYINVMNTLFKYCLVSGPPSEELLNTCMDSIEDIGTFFTPDRLMGGLQRIVDFLLSQYNEYFGKKRYWLLDQIIEYINKNYSSPITMKNVANQFYLNPSYFCKLFKDETGLTFTHYLMKLRVEKAKDLLRGSNKKLYNIAAAVGYINPQYFSTIFNEIEGVTPSQYRNSQHLGVNQKQPEYSRHA